MSNANNTTTRSGIGCTAFFVVLLQILLIALQLTGNIEWVWWQVWSPFLLYAGCIVSLLAGILVGAFIWLVFEEWRKKK